MPDSVTVSGVDDAADALVTLTLPQGEPAPGNKVAKVEIHHQLLRLVPEDEELTFHLEPVNDGNVTSDALYLDRVTLTATGDAPLAWGEAQVPLPPGADIESTTWGIKIRQGHQAEDETVSLTKENHESGVLHYMIPVKSLQGERTFSHLVRFSQKGTFTLPPIRYQQTYAPQNVVYEAGGVKTLQVR